MSSSEKVYQIKVTLRRSKPPIWRRLLVPSDATLLDLHRIIQIAMGWTNSHLHQFIIDGEYYSVPTPWDMAETGDENDYTLAQVAPTEKDKFRYEYDFGDSWEHEILVEKILPLDPEVHVPTCIKGKRACPPEDVGGVWGYAGFLQAINDPDHEDHETLLEWVGEQFDPEAFDLDDINRGLQDIDNIVWWDEEF